MLILYSFFIHFSGEKQSDLSYNEEIKGGSKHKETKQSQLHPSKTSEKNMYLGQRMWI